MKSLLNIFVINILDDGDDDVNLEIGDDIDLECFGNTNISDEPNAQDGRDGNENNENEADWLTRSLAKTLVDRFELGRGSDK